MLYPGCPQSQSPKAERPTASCPRTMSTGLLDSRWCRGRRVSGSRVRSRSDLQVALLDITLQPVETRGTAVRLPSRNAAVEDVVHLLKGLSLCLGSAAHLLARPSVLDRYDLREEHVDESKAIEGSEDHVHLPVDAPQKRGHTKGENAVPEPVGRCGEGDGFGADLGWEDLGGVCPGGRTPGGGEAGDEEVRAGDDALRDALVVDDAPGRVLVGVVPVLAVGCLECTGDEEPGHHEERSDQKRRAAAKSVKVEDRRKRHGDVDDVLDRGGEKRIGDVGSFHDVNDVVHPRSVNEQLSCYRCPTRLCSHGTGLLGLR